MQFAQLAHGRSAPQSLVGTLAIAKSPVRGSGAYLSMQMLRSSLTSACTDLMKCTMLLGSNFFEGSVQWGPTRQDPLGFRYGEAPSLKGTVIKALDSEVWPLKDPETMEFVTLQTVAFPLGAVVLLHHTKKWKQVSKSAKRRQKRGSEQSRFIFLKKATFPFGVSLLGKKAAKSRKVLKKATESTKVFIVNAVITPTSSGLPSAISYLAFKIKRGRALSVQQRFINSLRGGVQPKNVVQAEERLSSNFASGVPDGHRGPDLGAFTLFRAFGLPDFPKAEKGQKSGKLCVNLPDVVPIRRPPEVWTAPER
ncbi:hypothetical protein FA13DRAFT_1719609 [Coprinellus micaceus]|uniref:Uncharacterized protein n=1 Tax=Coprinellus micaceus TaxID=71717 RepID=A0A4Y7SB41_COPMI|nr:hypothetical protein FA13DRAFT_1719609 [Coprinellus micaceus]